jgi:hypothetical protein
MPWLMAAGALLLWCQPFSPQQEAALDKGETGPVS